MNNVHPVHKLIRWLGIAQFSAYGVIVCCIGLITLIVHR